MSGLPRHEGARLGLERDLNHTLELKCRRLFAIDYLIGRVDSRFDRSRLSDRSPTDRIDYLYDPSIATREDVQTTTLVRYSVGQLYRLHYIHGWAPIVVVPSTSRRPSVHTSNLFGSPRLIPISLARHH